MLLNPGSVFGPYEVVLTPVESADAPKQEHEVVFLQRS